MKVSALVHFILFAAACSLFGREASAQQIADSTFRAVVERPAYVTSHPKVVIDEAHSNFHTADGRYKPFAELLRNDGYRVERGTGAFRADSLADARVLVIANALAPDATRDTSGSAFTDEECLVVRNWVERGGSLLLIADHTPFGAAAAKLASQFGVEMGEGYVFDIDHSEAGDPTTLVFARKNGLLGDHPILRGRRESEGIERVVTFTGQSLGVPAGAKALLMLSPDACEAATGAGVRAAYDAAMAKTERDTTACHPVRGRAQAIAMTFGEGKVVVLGEAAMFSAQVARFGAGHGPRERKVGMGVPGNDDKQFALNVMHWLSGLLK